MKYAHKNTAQPTANSTSETVAATKPKPSGNTVAMRADATKMPVPSHDAVIVAAPHNSVGSASLPPTVMGAGADRRSRYEGDGPARRRRTRSRPADALPRPSGDGARRPRTV